MIRIAIVGTGGVAAYHATTFSKIRGCRVVAGCDVDAGRAETFCVQHSIPRHVTDPAVLFQDNSIDAIVNSTPDRFHGPISIAAIKAGKHVLCEKPLALNHAEAAGMVRIAKARGVVNMVNFGYRNAPAVQKAHRIVASGRLGEIVHLDTSYLQSWLVSSDWRTTPGLIWRLSKAHGSLGVLGDIGIHVIDLAHFIVGGFKSVNTQLKCFSQHKGRSLGKYTLDANDTALIQAEMENGALGMVHTTRWGTGHLNTISMLVCGTKGALRFNLDTAWNKVQLSVGKDIQAGKWKEVSCPPTPSIAELFIRTIRTGVTVEPSFQEGARAQRVLDACFASDARGRRVSV